jgi:mRNA interferase RelE/StbE
MERGEEKDGAVSSFKVVISPTALEILENIQDKRVRRKLAERIESLCVDPEKQGKALSGDLAGLLSVLAVGQRYRIIYQDHIPG